MKTFPNRRVHCCLSSGTENSSGSLDVMGVVLGGMGHGQVSSWRRRVR